MSNYSKAISALLTGIVSFVGLFWAGILEIANPDIIASVTSVLVILAGVIFGPANKPPA